MPSRKIESQLETLSALRSSGATEAAVATLRKALNDRVNLVVAKAAGMTAQLHVRSLMPDLVAAFDRLLESGAAGDPQCWGKNALARALKELGCDECGCFIRGLQHQQFEPVWGTTTDTAGTLRSICVLALLQCADLTRDEKLWHQMRALTDQEAVVRLEAARALEEMEGREAAFLLRLKAGMGDREPNVTGQVLASLMTIEREGAVAFVAGFLNSEEEVQAEAALALGGSRLPAALEVLIDNWQRRKGFGGESILRGISASRQEDAIDFLLRVVLEGSKREAVVALDALSLHRDSAEIRSRVAKVVDTRSNLSLADEFSRRFPAA